MLGSTLTVSGKRVSEDSALKVSAVCAATRIISETLASLPFNTLEQVDYRTQNKAIDHPLYRILHDIPNPEQDSMTWFDQQTAFIVNWGNCYAEIQRFDGEIVALWPIHPSRIPLRNITRNPTDPSDWHSIVVGKPGEIVYWVKNDDGTVTPIPKVDMLHVPGVLSSNGITGQSIVQLAANSIGIGMATEEHAGALFKNGAVSNIALTSPTKVSQATAERLRKQWQDTFAGVSNHYKTLLLEEGVTPAPINMNPEETQLILARQFSVTEIARWYRLPPHLLADLSRSTFANIEAENLSFVVHSMLPWIARWERALYRQLLTTSEKARYRFRFNVNGLLRGDTAARAQFYQVMFNLGAFSPNDIRAREDENPIPGGDQYFVQGNNAVPLDKVGQLAQAQIDAANKPDPAPQQAAMNERLAELRKLQEHLIRQVELRDVADKSVHERVSAHFERQSASIAEIYTQVGAISTTLSEQGEYIQLIVPKLAEVAALTSTVVDTTHQFSATLDVSGLMQKLDEHGEILADLPSEIAKNLPIAAATPKIDTSAAESVAIRETDVARREAELSERVTSERTVTEQTLAVCLKRGIESLAAWEAKALLGARESPRDFPRWRNEFYPRFLKRFSHELSDLTPAFESCGLILDLDWGGMRYSSQSIDDLKTLDVACGDNHYDYVKTCTDHFVKSDWTERPSALATEMVERGRRLFEERKDTKCVS